MAELLWEERSSKGIVEDFYNTKSYAAPSGKYHDSPTDYGTLMAMTESDPVLTRATELTADLCTYNGYTFIGDESVVTKAREQFDDEFDFDQVIYNTILQLVVYKEAYIEVEWNESHTQVLGLSPLPTECMKINYTESGELVGYTQKLEGKAESEWPKFASDEVIFLRTKWMGKRVHSWQTFSAISKSFATSVYANNYLQSMFINLPPKIVYFLKNANEKQRKQFIHNITRAKTNPSTDIIAQGDDFEAKMLLLDIQPAFIQILDRLKLDILTVTGVPPHWVGMLDGANRGIGENVVIPFETKLKKLQQVIASQINKQLMPKLKLDVEFKWNAISLQDEKTIIGNMGQLKAVGLDNDSLIDYAREHGLKLRDDAFIMEAPPQGSGQPSIQMDSAPSRQRNNPKDSMNSGMNKMGVSDAGKAKLDANKVM